MRRPGILIAILLGFYALPTGAQDEPDASTRTHTITVRDGVAYVGQTGGLVIRDVSDPLRPVDRSWLSLPASVLDVALDGDHALLAAGTRGMVVADVSDPAEPAELARLDTDGKVKRVLRVEHWAYVADGVNGLLIVDLRKLDDPRIIARISTGGDLRAISRQGDMLAVAEAHGGARVFSIKRRDNPRELRRLETDFAARDVCWVGERLFVAAGNHGTAVYEPEGSSRPLGFLEALRSAQHVACGGGLVAVSNLGSAMQIFDAQERVEHSRLRVHRSAPIGRANFDGDRLWIAVDSAGMGLLELSDPEAPEHLLPRRREFKVRYGLHVLRFR